MKKAVREMAPPTLPGWAHPERTIHFQCLQGKREAGRPARMGKALGRPKGPVAREAHQVLAANEYCNKLAADLPYARAFTARPSLVLVIGSAHFTSVTLQTKSPM